MAIRYFKPGSTVWNSASSWATTVGGSDNAPAVPTNLDDVTFDLSSGATCAITTTVGTCKTLTCTGYTGTITTSVQLTVSGNVTLGVSSTHSGSAAMVINAAATLVSNANTKINCPVTFSTATTFTLSDDWTFNALFSTAPAAGTITLDGSNIYCKGGMFINSGGSSVSLTTGTTNIFITGTGTIFTTANTTGGISNNFTINAPGSTITLGQAYVYFRTNTFRYIAGTISGTWNFNITGNCTLDMTNGGTHTLVTPFTLVIQVASTITMSSDWYLTGIAIGFLTTINGSSLYSTGTISITTALTGTTTIRLKGSGAGQTFSSTATIGNDVSFEAGANTVNITSIYITPRSGGSSLTYTSGTVNHSGTLTIAGPNAVTLSTAGMSWNNVTFTGASFTITINSLLTALGTLSFQNQNYTFAGTAGFTVGTLTYLSTPTVTNTGIVLVAGLTYTVTTSLSLYSLALGTTYLGIKSATPGSIAFLTLRNGAAQTIGNIQTTDINSSGGQTIWVWRPGTISNCVNIQSLTPALMQRSATYVN